MNKQFANGENQFLKVDNAVPSLDEIEIRKFLNAHGYESSWGNKASRNVRLIQDFLKYLQNGVENSKKQRTYSYHEMALAHSHGYSLCLGSSHDLLEFEDWIKTLMANSELQK